MQIIMPEGDFMRYPDTCQALFLDRPNRFVAHVLLNGVTQTVHVKNTGRCRELLLPGSEVTLAGPFDSGRKTRYDLIAVEKQGLGLVNMDSQAPNALVKEWLETRPALFGDNLTITPEYTFGSSRIDFMLEGPGRRILIEVKGCTLQREGIGYFPDAPTARGVKHLRELTAATASGWECWLTFAVTMPHVTRVLPNRDTDPDFADALTQACRAGVKVLVLPCRTSPDQVTVADALVQSC